MMLSLKKVCRDELLQIALLLSLLRVEPSEWSVRVPAVGVGGPSSSSSWEFTGHGGGGTGGSGIHPKSIVNHEQRILNELSSLGRYNRFAAGLWQNVTAYMGLTSHAEDGAVASTSSGGDSSTDVGSLGEPFLPPNSSAWGHFEEHSFADDEDSLTPEDMDLIEVLWKQDVDMGFSIQEWQEAAATASLDDPAALNTAEEDEEVGSVIHLKDKLKDAPKGEDSEKEEEKKDEKEVDQWEGHVYTIDIETGEYIIKEDRTAERADPGAADGDVQPGAEEDLPETLTGDDEPPSSALIPPGQFSLEEALQLVGLNDDLQFLESGGLDGGPLEVESSSEEPGGEDEGRKPESLPTPAGRGTSAAALSSASSGRASSSSSPEPGRIPDELEIFEEMIHGPTSLYPSAALPRSQQGRMGYMRAGSMEQRWQDLASLLSLPEPHYLSGGGAVAPPAGGGAAVTAPSAGGYHPSSAPSAPAAAVVVAPGGGVVDVKPLSHEHSHPTVVAPYSPHPITGGNGVGSAVASSMNLMTNSSEPMGGEAGATAFKMENTHDMMYYQNGTTDINPSSDGFLSSILNDEDLQLMDMAMTEGGGNGSTTGLYQPLRLGETGGTDSDSAVSSMGSERVPSLGSDSEWVETNSDSGQTPDHYTEYSRNKYRWYDYGYGGRQISGESSRQVAQKKHHMYGKRVFQDQTSGGGGLVGGGGPNLPLKSEYPANLSPSVTPNYPPSLNPELKYSCSVEFSRQALSHQGARSTPAQIAAHNHTYHMLPESCGSQERPLARDKKDLVSSMSESYDSDAESSSGRKNDEEAHLTRDERRARALNIPIPVDDIINLPMDEFNERLSKYDLSESQLSLIRDIRRRGKNKVAAQNCRKRKLDQILCLADEVKQMRERKNRLLHDRQLLFSERQRVKSKFSQLYKHIFQSLRDSEGNAYSPYEWSLQQSSDGSVALVPRGNQTSLMDQPPPPSSSASSHHKRLP